MGIRTGINGKHHSVDSMRCYWSEDTASRAGLDMYHCGMLELWQHQSSTHIHVDGI